MDQGKFVVNGNFIKRSPFYMHLRLYSYQTSPNLCQSCCLKQFQDKKKKVPPFIRETQSSISSMRVVDLKAISKQMGYVKSSQLRKLSRLFL